MSQQTNQATTFQAYTGTTDDKIHVTRDNHDQTQSESKIYKHKVFEI